MSVAKPDMMVQITSRGNCRQGSDVGCQLTHNLEEVSQISDQRGAKTKRGPIWQGVDLTSRVQGGCPKCLFKSACELEIHVWGQHSHGTAVRVVAGAGYHPLVGDDQYCVKITVERVITACEKGHGQCEMHSEAYFASARHSRLA
jgi:hypothetical protein